MSDSVSEFAVNRNNENIKLIPKLLNKEETLLLAEKDFGRQSDFGADQIKEFVNDHVKIVQIGNTDVTIIDQEHDDYTGDLNPVLKAYLNSSRTRTAVVEYFLPELERNA